MAVGAPTAPQRRSDNKDCATELSPHARLFITRSPASVRRIAHHAQKKLFKLIRGLGIG